MRSSLVLVSFVALVTGCSHAAPPPAVPQQTLAAVVEVAPPPAEEAQAEPEPEPAPAPERVKHHVEITVDQLPAPKTFAPGATTYVFWVRANDDEAWSNASHLEQAKDTQEARFEFAEDVLFVHVTAEASADVRKPSDKVILSTRVSSNGACAHTVDQNDVKMRVRMCH